LQKCQSKTQTKGAFQHSNLDRKLCKHAVEEFWCKELFSSSETGKDMHYSAQFCSDDLFSSAAVLQKVNRFLPIILLSLSSNPSVSHL